MNRSLEFGHRQQGMVYPRAYKASFTIEIEYKDNSKKSKEYQSWHEAMSYAEFILSAEYDDLTSISNIWMVTKEDGDTKHVAMIYGG